MRFPGPVFAGCILVFWSAGGWAATYQSTGSAGELPAAAEIVSNPVQLALTAITGTINVSNGISAGRIFEIYINQPTLFSASTTAFSLGVNNFDTQLFLFNAAGVGVVANDDDPSTGHQQAAIPAGTSEMASEPAGNYFILIEGGGRYPEDSGGNLLFPNYTDGVTDPASILGPTGPGGANPIGTLGDFSGQGGNFSIALTGAQFVATPEPVAALLLGLGAVACGRPRFRRRGPCT